MNPREKHAKIAREIVNRSRSRQAATPRVENGVSPDSSYAPGAGLCEVAFTVPGNPLPKERPRVVRGRTFTPKRTLDAEKRVAWYARNAMGGKQPFACPVAVTLSFHRDSSRWVDLDNIVKLVLDACNRILYDDDKRIVEIHAWKCVDKVNPRTRVFVRRAQ